ncbi:hypothetical protein LCGC14_0532270 [marine sediment metagenome]|uniref:Uncharacterized protein n=1 Tax=marine sediment metagenome TaxID=412755 RepID=A0A0F9V3E2_9ZZZZ
MANYHKKDEMSEANAKLIAQAPDMHHLLTTILKRLDLEAKERDVFPCAALRNAIRRTLAATQ